MKGKEPARTASKVSGENRSASHTTPAAWIAPIPATTAARRRRKPRRPNPGGNPPSDQGDTRGPPPEGRTPEARRAPGRDRTPGSAPPGALQGPARPGAPEGSGGWPERESQGGGSRPWPRPQSGEPAPRHQWCITIFCRAERTPGVFPPPSTLRQGHVSRNLLRVIRRSRAGPRKRPQARHFREIPAPLSIALERPITGFSRTTFS
jgi:hypothetical protein